MRHEKEGSSMQYGHKAHRGVNALRSTSRDHGLLPSYEAQPHHDHKCACLSLHVACTPYVYPRCKAYPTACHDPIQRRRVQSEPWQDAFPVWLVTPAGVRDGRWRQDGVPDTPRLSRQAVHSQCRPQQVRCYQSVFLGPKLS